MKILGIETSCDDTAIALLGVKDDGQKTPSEQGNDPPAFQLLANEVSSQLAAHAEYGGIVPGLARREHAKNLIPVLLRTLESANGKTQTTDSRENGKRPAISDELLAKYFERYPELPQEFKEKIVPLKKPDIDLIAVTQGPGLEPALWVGLNFAKALSALWDIPVIGIDHMEGHIAVNLLAQVSASSNDQIPISKGTYNQIQFPAVTLAVSGGHTQLILVKEWLDYELLGETVDDAAGEAFDKVARMLGLPFPGGPAIEQHAAQWKSQFPNPNFQINSKIQISNKNIEITLPVPMLHSDNFNFSFSGLKTAVRYDYESRDEKLRKSEQYVNAMSYAAQEAIITVLVTKTLKAAKQHNAKTVMLAGGVAANKPLKETLKKELSEKLPDANLIVPEPKLATDNGAMIAVAGYLHYKKGERSNTEKLNAESGKLITEKF